MHPARALDQTLGSPRPSAVGTLAALVVRILESDEAKDLGVIVAKYPFEGKGGGIRIIFFKYIIFSFKKGEKTATSTINQKKKTLVPDK